MNTRHLFSSILVVLYLTPTFVNGSNNGSNARELNFLQNYHTPPGLHIHNRQHTNTNQDQTTNTTIATVATTTVTSSWPPTNLLIPNTPTLLPFPIFFPPLFNPFMRSFSRPQAPINTFGPQPIMIPQASYAQALQSMMVINQASTLNNSLLVPTAVKMQNSIPGPRINATFPTVTTAPTTIASSSTSSMTTHNAAAVLIEISQQRINMSQPTLQKNQGYNQPTTVADQAPPLILRNQLVPSMADNQPTITATQTPTLHTTAALTTAAAITRLKTRKSRPHSKAARKRANPLMDSAKIHPEIIFIEPQIPLTNPDTKAMYNNEIKPEEYLDQTTKRFRCPEGCISTKTKKASTFQASHKLLNHIATHLGKRWKCSGCNKLFLWIEGFRKHKEDIHNKRTKRCPYCGEDFPKGYFETHVKRELREYTYYCHYCNKGFVTSTDRNSHEESCRNPPKS